MASQIRNNRYDDEIAIGPANDFSSWDLLRPIVILVRCGNTSSARS
jgi:hypothetical protein